MLEKYLGKDNSIQYECQVLPNSYQPRSHRNKSKLSSNSTLLPGKLTLGENIVVLQSSIIIAEKQEEWIESDECVKACGLERMSVGLSTDLLMDYHFTEMFCSSECLNNCPNIIDLYISLAAGEGMQQRSSIGN